MPDSGMTRRPVRLLHLSDIHFGAEDREALAAFETLAARVKPEALLTGHIRDAFTVHVPGVRRPRAPMGSGACRQGFVRRGFVRRGRGSA